MAQTQIQITIHRRRIARLPFVGALITLIGLRCGAPVEWFFVVRAVQS